ncbi:MAG: cell division protein FtsB [Burkholderiales bacterium]
MSRAVALVLSLLIALLAYASWWGKGGWKQVWELDAQLRSHQQLNRELAARNAGLDAEVRDLKQGYHALEERARSELGMIKKDEVFFQITEKPTQ